MPSTVLNTCSFHPLRATFYSTRVAAERAARVNMHHDSLSRRCSNPHHDNPLQPLPPLPARRHVKLRTDLTRSRSTRSKGNKGNNLLDSGSRGVISSPENEPSFANSILYREQERADNKPCLVPPCPQSFFSGAPSSVRLEQTYIDLALRMLI